VILLDTNVVSEAMKPVPQPQVQAWLDQQVAETLYLSSVTVAELLFGIAALPDGRRKQLLGEAVDGLLALFADRILPFDLAAAQRFAQLATLAGVQGRGFPTPDGYIAAIAASKGFIVASRDVAPYAAAGVDVINPWQALP
jgi:predicted nucleic acid-binding protein